MRPNPADMKQTGGRRIAAFDHKTAAGHAHQTDIQVALPSTRTGHGQARIAGEPGGRLGVEGNDIANPRAEPGGHPRNRGGDQHDGQQCRAGQEQQRLDRTCFGIG